MSRYRQLVRVLKLAEIVRDDIVTPVRIEVYARDLHVSTRTIRRDLIALKAAGWPLVIPNHRDVGIHV